MNRKERKEFGESNLAQLRSLAKPLGIEVTVLNQFPLHVRVLGANTVDYWPTTNKAWELNSMIRSAHYSPFEVIALAGTRRAVAEGETPTASKQQQDVPNEQVDHDFGVPDGYKPGWTES